VRELIERSSVNQGEQNTGMNTKVYGWLAAGLMIQGVTASWGVTFQFSAPISLVYGPGASAVSNVVTVGATCTGTVSYNVTNASVDLNPSANTGLYQFQPNGMQITLQVGTNVFSSTISSSDYIIVGYQQNSPMSDGITYEIRGATLNGGPVPGATDSQTLDVSLSTTNLSALTSDTLPTQVPLLSDYPGTGGNGFHEVVFYTYKGGTFNYGFSGTLSWMGTVPTLSATSIAPGQVLLSWPTNATGFQLQSSPTPSVSGPWTAVPASATIQNNNFQAILQFGQTNQYFRLSGPILNSNVR
jgi:hypothetical protein